MHEITILVQLVNLVEKEARANHVAENIDTIVVQLGQLSSIVPKYLTEYYPNVTEGTLLYGSKLEIEMIPGNGLCHHCNKVFHIVEHKGKCPICNGDDWEMLSGQEFILKEIRIRESEG
ncbi:MAG: hydrogenase maturation nickel metallochaperone HypA [Lachnospiraceae bacterium]